MAPTMMPINQRLTTEALCNVEVPEPLHNGDDAADDVDLKRVEQPGDAQDHREHKVPARPRQGIQSGPWTLGVVLGPGHAAAPP